MVTIRRRFIPGYSGGTAPDWAPVRWALGPASLFLRAVRRCTGYRADRNLSSVYSRGHATGVPPLDDGGRLAAEKPFKEGPPFWRRILRATFRRMGLLNRPAF